MRMTEGLLPTGAGGANGTPGGNGLRVAGCWRGLDHRLLSAPVGQIDCTAAGGPLLPLGERLELRVALDELQVLVGPGEVRAPATARVSVEP